MNGDKRLIVALDVHSMEKVQQLVEQLGDSVNYYKVGMELFYSVGSQVITYLRQQNKDIFLDLAKGLGESDLDGHKKIFSLAEYKLKNTIAALEEKNDKTVKMYRCLGFSVGAMVTILLI